MGTNAVSEFEFFPSDSSSSALPPSVVHLTRTVVDANGVISSASGIRPHIPTVAKAFRERLRNSASPATFKKELHLMWRQLFRAPSDLSLRPELLMVHSAACEFALNELVLACEEWSHMESRPVEKSEVLAPLEFLKQDPGFLAVLSTHLRLAAPVTSVLVRLTASLMRIMTTV
jgi:hypothetical protein